MLIQGLQELTIGLGWYWGWDTLSSTTSRLLLDEYKVGYFSRLDLAPKGWDTMDMGGILCGLSLY